MRYFPLIKSSLLFVIVSLLVTACGGTDTTTLNGTMTVQTRPMASVIALQSQEIPGEPGWFGADLTTRATVTTEDTDDGLLLEFLDFFGAGTFGSHVQRMSFRIGETLESFEVSLDSTSTSGGFVGDQHDILLHLVVTINGQELTFNDLQFVGSGDSTVLEAETAPLPYIGSDGTQQELRIGSVEKDLSPLPGFGSTTCPPDDCATFVCPLGSIPACLASEGICFCVET